MTKPQRITVAAFALLAGAAVVVVGKARSARGAAKTAASASMSGDRLVPVDVAAAVMKDVPIIVEGLGTVTPLATVVVKSQVDGRLDNVVFAEGDTVKKGDLLAVIDSRPYAIQLRQGSAALARDTASLKNAQLTLERYLALRAENLVPQQQVDDQKAAVEQLAAVTKADEAVIANAQLYLDYARITSPIDGVTGIRLVDPGNLVRTTDPGGIVVVTKLDPMAVLFTLPQDELPRIQKALTRGKPAVEAYARDDSKRLGKGQLELIDNQVNAQTATVRLKATMPNPERALWPNQFVKAHLHLDTITKAIVVPAAAIQRSQTTFVYVVGQDKTVATRDVVVASIEGDDAIVTKGLSAGESVVTEGQTQLRPGAKVAPRSPKQGVTAAASRRSGSDP